MKPVDAVRITRENEQTFRKRRPLSSWARKDTNLTVSANGKYVQIRFDVISVIGDPIPAVVNKGFGLLTKDPNGVVYDYVPLEDRWQWWMYEFCDWQTGRMFPKGEFVEFYTLPKNSIDVIYSRYTPGSLLSLYAERIKDAKSHSDSYSPETGGRDVVTRRNLFSPRPYEWLCRPTLGALLKVVGEFGIYWRIEAIDLLKPCPDVDFLPAHHYFWATQIEGNGNVTRYPDVKNELEAYGIPPAGTAYPLFSLGGSFLIPKSICTPPLVPGQAWSPYKT
jgi:hypothetical protein